MDEIVGPYLVTFIQGEPKIIDVKMNMINGNADPLYLVSTDETIYPWMNIFSIKKET